MHFNCRYAIQPCLLNTLYRQFVVLNILDDIAVDWISYKLYWVDSTWARIEAMDLNTSIRVEVLATGANTIPRAIAVDPMNR